MPAVGLAERFAQYFHSGEGIMSEMDAVCHLLFQDRMARKNSPASCCNELRSPFELAGLVTAIFL